MGVNFMHPNWFVKVWSIKMFLYQPREPFFVFNDFCETVALSASKQKMGQEYTPLLFVGSEIRLSRWRICIPLFMYDGFYTLQAASRMSSINPILSK